MQTVIMAGLEVSRLCFGTLTMGPLQKSISIDEGAELICYAYSKGINFFDTAELYGTYPYLKEAIKRIGKGGRPIISTKSYAYDTEGARRSVEKARQEMDIDVIDIFMMHEQETRLTLEGHREALEYYLEQKSKGIIKAVGVSTHAIEVVKACAIMPEIDVIHPIVNIAGLGIIDGSEGSNAESISEQMINAISLANNAGKGVFAMKPLGGGNLAKSYSECMQFVLSNENIHSIAMGMQSQDEVDMNITIFNGEGVSDLLREKCSKDDKYLNVADWCQRCGMCVEACQFGALSLGNHRSNSSSRVVVNKKKCVTCGYCSRKCPLFALKIY